MNSPLTFDLIIGLAFFFAVLFGAAFGFFRMLLIFLAFYSSMIAALLLMAAGVNVPHLMAQDRVLAAAVAFGMPLALTILAIAFGPRARSAAGRFFGVFLAAAWATVAVPAATMVASLANPDMQQVLREKTLTGPAVFAVGDALVSLLPDNPGTFQKRGQPKA